MMPLNPRERGIAIAATRQIDERFAEIRTKLSKMANYPYGIHFIGVYKIEIRLDSKSWRPKPFRILHWRQKVFGFQTKTGRVPGRGVGV